MGSGASSGSINPVSTQQKGFVRPIAQNLSLSANNIRTGTTHHGILIEPIGKKHWKSVLEAYKLTTVIQQLEDLGVVSNGDLLALPNNVWDEICLQLKFLEMKRFSMMKEQYCTEHPSYDHSGDGRTPSSSARSSPAPYSSSCSGYSTTAGFSNSGISDAELAQSLSYNTDPRDDDADSDNGIDSPVYPEKYASYDEIVRQIVLLREDLAGIGDTLKEGFATGGIGSVYCRSMLMLSRSLLQARLQRCRTRKVELEAQSRAGGGNVATGSNSIAFNGTSVHGERSWSASRRSPSPSPSTSSSGSNSNSNTNSKSSSKSNGRVSPVLMTGSGSTGAMPSKTKTQSLNQMVPRGQSASSKRAQGAALAPSLGATQLAAGRRISFDKSVKFPPGSSDSQVPLIAPVPVRQAAPRAYYTKPVVAGPTAARLRPPAGSVTFG